MENESWWELEGFAGDPKLQETFQKYDDLAAAVLNANIAETDEPHCALFLALSRIHRAQISQAALHNQVQCSLIQQLGKQVAILQKEVRDLKSS